MEQVRIGVISTSWWADTFFLPVLSGYERANLVAICGRNQTRADEIAAKFSIPQVYSDYRQMIDQAKLDAVVVAAPDDLHYAMVMSALDAGLHVICDKPVANNADHARQMLDKAEAAALKHMVMYTWRWLPQVQYIKHLLDDGYLGRPYQASLRFGFGVLNSRDYAWRVDADRANGALGDVGSHVIDMARWFLGDVTSVSASLKTLVERDGPDGRPLNPANDSALLLLEFASGAHGTIELSLVNHLADKAGVQVSLYGENGTLRTDNYFDHLTYEVRGARRDEDAFDRLEMPPEFSQGFVVDDLITAYRTETIGPRLFIDGILDDRAVEPNLYDGYKNQQVIDAALESQRSGQRISIV